MSLKTPLTPQDLLVKLHDPEIRLKPSLFKNPINNTQTRFWITRAKEGTTADLMGALKDNLKENFDWVAAGYANPKIPGEKGIICPLPNVLVVTFNTDITLGLYDELKAKYNMIVVTEKSKYYDEDTKYFILGNPSKNRSYEVKSILESQIINFRSISFEHMPMILPITYVPNDTDYSKQWNMQKISAGGTISTPHQPFDIGTTTWDLTTGRERIVICVMDSGCDLTHPDIKFVRPGKNLDTMSDGGSPVELPGVKAIGHGTAIAGIIAATIDNSIGVAGVAGRCKILPYAFENWTDEELIRGINAAIEFNSAGSESKVKVVNISLDLSLADTTRVDEAITRASSSILFCASSGNDDKDGITYPANHPLVMACGATTKSDKRKRKTATSPLDDWGSNFGGELSVVAPGVSISSTDMVGSKGYNKTGDYVDNFVGTSAAVAHLSGLAGLLFSVYDGIDPKRVRNIIENTADKVGSVNYINDFTRPNGKYNNEMGYGRINTLRAVIAASAFYPDLPWFRTVEVSGSVDLQDYEPEPGANNEVATYEFESGETIKYQVDPFQQRAQLPFWTETVGGEIRTLIDIYLEWKLDSSVDVHYYITLYEGVISTTDDLDGEERGIKNIPLDKEIDLDVKVTNTAENTPEDFVHLNMKFTNRRRIF